MKIKEYMASQVKYSILVQSLKTMKNHTSREALSPFSLLSLTYLSSVLHVFPPFVLNSLPYLFYPFANPVNRWSVSCF